VKEVKFALVDFLSSGFVLIAWLSFVFVSLDP
jgi:hypothetical protein